MTFATDDDRRHCINIVAKTLRERHSIPYDDALSDAMYAVVLAESEWDPNLPYPTSIGWGATRGIQRATDFHRAWYGRNGSRTRTATARTVSLDISPDEDPDVNAWLCDEAQSRETERQENAEYLEDLIHAALDPLRDPRYAYVLRQIVAGRQNVDLASELGVCATRVGQLRSLAIAHIRAYVRRHAGAA